MRMTLISAAGSSADACLSWDFHEQLGGESGLKWPLGTFFGYEERRFQLAGAAGGDIGGRWLADAHLGHAGNSPHLIRRDRGLEAAGGSLGAAAVAGLEALKTSLKGL